MPPQKALVEKVLTRLSPAKILLTERLILIVPEEYRKLTISRFQNARALKVDDVLFSVIGGNIGNQVMVKDALPLSIKNVALFKYYSEDYTVPKFFKKYTENLAESLQSQASGGAQPFISLGALRTLLFPLPPAVEQYRIVTKVDELMVLCDDLKQQLNKAQTTQMQLTDAVLENAFLGGGDIWGGCVVFMTNQSE